MASAAALAAAAATVVEVLVGGLANVEDLAAEAEMHPGQIVVEIHLYMLFADLADNAHDRAAVGSLHH